MSPDVPYLTKGAIEDEAALLLAEFARDHHPIAAPPVPIDEIIELHLKLTFEMSDLRKLFGHGDVHGAIWFRAKKIAVDQQLDPVRNANMRGRFNFTLAHETGHWRLHRKFFLRGEGEQFLYDQSPAPADYVCRSSDKRPVEWQADSFASHLLMPRALVRQEWEQWHGSLDAIAIDDLDDRQTRLATELIRRGGAKTGKDAENDMILEHTCRPLAERFHVSPEAMRIRLEDFGFLLRKRMPSLFS